MNFYSQCILEGEYVKEYLKSFVAVNILYLSLWVNMAHSKYYLPYLLMF